MKLARVKTLLVLILLSLLGAKNILADEVIQPSQLEYAADVISVKGGNLRIKRITSPLWFRGHVNTPNYVKDILETDENTVACIEFLNGSQLGINKGTTIEIISTTGARDITKRSVIQKIMLKSGTIWAKITGRKSRNFQVDTNKGVLGVKGTEFVVESKPEEDYEKITVLEGSVEYVPKKEEANKQTEESKEYLLTPGDEITFEENKPPKKEKKSVEELRNALDMRFPGLNPVEQAIVSAFAYNAIGAIPGASQALSIARETLDFVDNPERYIANRVASEISSRTGVWIPGGIFGGGGRRSSSSSPPKIEDLQPNGDTIYTYYPEFKWKKIKKANAYRVIITKKPLVKGVKDPGYIAIATVKENQWKYPPNARALKPSWEYHWIVIALNKDKKPITRPSDPASFKLASYEKLGIRGLYPVGEIEPFRGDLVFDWTGVNEAYGYKIELSRKDTFENPIISKVVKENYFILKDASLMLFKEREYYWRVIPLDKDRNEMNFPRSINKFIISVGGK